MTRSGRAGADAALGAAVPWAHPEINDGEEGDSHVNSKKV
jgi:hypothetical protein